MYFCCIKYVGKHIMVHSCHGFWTRSTHLIFNVGPYSHHKSHILLLLLGMFLLPYITFSYDIIWVINIFHTRVVGIHPFESNASLINSFVKHSQHSLSSIPNRQISDVQGRGCCSELARKVSFCLQKSVMIGQFQRRCTISCIPFFAVE